MLDAAMWRVLIQRVSDVLKVGDDILTYELL
jgi:hypothetical protein